MGDKSADDKFNSGIDNSNKNHNQLFKELNEEISFLKKRNRDLNVKIFRYSYRISSLNTKILSLRNDNNLNNNTRLETTKKLISEVSNMKSYRLAYFLNRTKNGLIKGSKEERKIYLKWVYLKLFRKKNPYDKRNNPLFNIINRI
ncbi:hypothetical protein DSECCO2_82850 [anaerobic digester metagenome]